jgi:hypothetical protein
MSLENSRVCVIIFKCVINVTAKPHETNME